jgi:hypothetical protein
MAPGAHGAQRKPKNAGKTFGRLAGYFKPHLFSLIVSSSACSSCAAGVQDVLLKPIINGLRDVQTSPRLYVSSYSLSRAVTRRR